MACPTAFFTVAVMVTWSGRTTKKIKEYLLLLIQICPGKNQDRRLQNIRNQGTNGIFEGWKGTCYGKSTMKAKINVA